MFFRRKRNKSGTYSVIVEDYRDGQKVIIQRIGTSRDELRLRSLERKAQQWIDDQRGPKLPFAWEKDDIISDFMSTLANSQVRVCGPETKEERTTVLKMSSEQQLLVEIAQKWFVGLIAENRAIYYHTEYTECTDFFGLEDNMNNTDNLLM